jgi:exoribonuclease-2
MAGKVGPGAVVEYYEDKKLLCAVCMELKNNRMLVLTEQDRQANIALKRILHVDGVLLDLTQSRAHLVATLQEMASRRRDLMNRISVEEVWDLLKEEEEGFDCQELAELCFSDEITADHTSAVLRALLNDSLHFKYKGELFYANTPERLEQIRLQHEREIQKEMELAESSSWLAAVWWGESVAEPRSRDQTVQMLKDFCLSGAEAASYQQAKKIFALAEIPLPHGPFELLVKLGIWKRDENLYLHRFGIRESFPEEVLRATVQSCDSLGSATGLRVEGREDLTALPLTTIDGPMTRDYDDALSVRFLAHGAEVAIHIADAAEYIPIDSPLDQEALARATSLYLPDARIPMLPPLLSEGHCSLKQGEDRLALSLLIDFDQDDRLVSHRFALSRVRVQRQLTYEEANEMVATDETLRFLFRLCTRLRRQRIMDGALHMPLPELRVWVNANGVIHIGKVDRETASQVVVSELMILANALAAGEMAANGVAAIYRSQEKPQEIVVREPTDDLYLNYRQRRYLSRAELSIRPKPHSGLGASAYTSWTSPIRRYVDLVVQRQLKSMVSGNILPYEPRSLEEIIPRVTLPQSRAALIKRQWTRYWILRHLEKEKTRILDALVLDQGRRTFHLLLPEYMLEASMPLDEGRGLNPGDHFRVQIVRVNAREEVLKLQMM